MWFFVGIYTLGLTWWFVLLSLLAIFIPVGVDRNRREFGQ
jgi:hypothetical protein